MPPREACDEAPVCPDRQRPCVWGLSACATDGSRSEPTYEAAARNELVSTNYRAADVLLGQLRNLDNEGPMLVATLVNIDALERSSTPGRLVSEQVAARFAQQGRAMVELKLRHTMYMRRTEGELALTREIAERPVSTMPAPSCWAVMA